MTTTTLAGRAARATFVLVVCGAFIASTNAASGCALISRGEALAIHWFSPEQGPVRLTSAPAPVGVPVDGGAAPTQRAPIAVELGRVTSGVHLRERIAYRASPYEVGYYDDRRWTERPDVYVRRAISRALFEERGVGRAFGGEAPVLDVEVIAFEEVRGPAPVARIELRVLLHQSDAALVQRTITIDRPAGANVSGGAPDTRVLVRAMSEALDEAAEEVAGLVDATLGHRR